MGMNAYTDKRNEEAESHSTYQGMTIYLASLRQVVGTNEMSYLHRETGGCCTQQATYQPGC